MINVGIICEFNPFHNGHEYLIRKVREKVDGDVCIIAVMSGNFVQRGQLAMTDMWKRAEAAVECGADLVFELPVWASCAGAEYFAEGAVGLLNKAGNIDYLAFGAEADGLHELERAAEAFAFETPELSQAIKSGLSKGKNYARARAEAAAEVLGINEEIINEPNNILAVEYLKQLKRTASKIKPLMVNRAGSGYFDNTEERGFAGAGWIRNRLKEGADPEEIKNYFPEKAYNILKNEKPLFMEAAYKYIIYKLITITAEEAALTDGAFEGLENRAVKAAHTAIDYESLVNGIKTKRYSRTTVERLLVRMLIGIKKTDVAEFRLCGRVCSRVLAFNRVGAAYLRTLKNNERFLAISNISKEWPEDETLSKIIELNLKAGNIYSLIAGECIGNEMKKHGIFKE